MNSRFVAVDVERTLLQRRLTLCMPQIRFFRWYAARPLRSRPRRLQFSYMSKKQQGTVFFSYARGGGGASLTVANGFAISYLPSRRKHAHMPGDGVGKDSAIYC